MESASAETVERAMPAAVSSASHAFFFDVDGTLLELRPNPGDVLADDELRGLLAALFAETGGAVALVSGRAVADLDRIFAPLVLPAAGLHGADLRFGDGSRRQPDLRLMDHARPEVARFVSQHDGLMLEDKGATLAVHFRQRPDLGPMVLQFMATFGPNQDIAVQEGKMVVELKAARFDKGTAIATFMQRDAFSGRHPVFYGDDLTDEAGFAEVNRLDGLSVRIGAPETPTMARSHLADPLAMRDVLRGLVNRVTPEPHT